MEYTDCINFLLTTSQHITFQNLKNKLAPYSITPAQYSVLKSLWDVESRTPKEVANIVCLDSSTITGIVDRLEAKGLLIRLTTKEDRRKVLLQITDLGLTYRTEIEQAVQDMNNEALSKFTDEEILQFKGYLQRFISK